MPYAPTNPARAARFGTIAFAGVLVFALVCVAAQIFRTDLDWTTAPLSFYLLGAHGQIVKAAYVALAASLVSLGLGFRAACVPARARIAPALFALGGAALVVTAFAESATRPGPHSLEARIHGLASRPRCRWPRSHSSRCSPTPCCASARAASARRP